MAKQADTPVRRQYLSIKSQYPETILFFRLGDFYETFDDDAETVARVLDIVLTSRSVGKGQRVPMAGIPHHAVENYLGRLIAKGYHVAICDQTSTEPVDGLMPRDVVRVITPGTIIEPGLLPGDANNYLACVIAEENRAGVAYVDITTGEFAATELLGTKIDIHEVLRAELSRLSPAEILSPENLLLNNDLPGHATQWPVWRFEFTRCEEALMTQFKVGSLDGFGVRGLPLAMRAAGTVVQYLQETRPDALNLLVGLKSYHLDEFMTLDSATRRNLELTETLRGDVSGGSLLAVLDRTVTPMGKRLMHQWVSKPLLDVGKIHQRQDGIEHFYDDGLSRVEIRAAFKPLADLERLTNRVVGGSAHPRDLAAIRSTLRLLPGLKGFFDFEEASPLDDILSNFNLCEEVANLLEHSLTDDPPAVLGVTGVIRTGFAKDLDDILSASQHARDWIKNLEPQERKRTGINTLKVGYNKVFGYYIEVTQANSELVPDDYIRKQTLVRAERYITPELKEYESLVLNAEERIKEIERRVFREVCERLSAKAKSLLSTARAIAQLDVLSTLAEVASHQGYVRPEVVPENVLEIEGSRHPVVERMLPSGRRFIPNEVIFEDGECVRIITGPNMSGKSTFLRQVALIVLMSQMGSFV
ncbi:MAG: DNA mismatch repair protein MutS, partial [Chloroflexota bacterium]